MKKLSSNTDLYNYLLLLGAGLKQRGSLKLSNLAIRATHAAGQSTEFLGESRLALQQILKEEKGALSAQERSDMQDVVIQLKDALG